MSHDRASAGWLVAVVVKVVFALALPDETFDLSSIVCHAVVPRATTWMAAKLDIVVTNPTKSGRRDGSCVNADLIGICWRLHRFGLVLHFSTARVSTDGLIIINPGRH